MRVSSISLDGFAASFASDGNLVKGCRENVYLLCPNLAERWEHNGDFTQWTFKIRDGVFWHDGQPFTARDAQFWVELAYFGIQTGEKNRLPAIFQRAFGDLKSLETLEGNRLRLTLGKPEPLLLEALTNPRNKTLHPRHLMRPRIDQGQLDVAPLDVGLVGTGPFKVQNYEKGIKLQVRRFDRYWERDNEGRALPFLDGIDFAIIRDPNAMDAAFRVSRLDGAARGEGFQLTTERKAAYERDLGEKVWFAEIKAQALGGAGLDFNVLKRGPWQDVRVRRAIALWIDKAASIEAVAGGFGFISPLLNPDSPFADPNFREWPGFNPITRERDRADAKRLLVEAGYPSGFEMGHLCRRLWVTACEFFQGQLSGLNISFKLQLVDDAGWNRGCISLDYDSMRCGRGVGTLPEASEIIYTRHSLGPQTSLKHEDPRIPAFYDRLRQSVTLDDRIKIWRELERYILLEQVYTVPMAKSLAVVAYRSHLRGVAVPQVEIIANNDFATTWLDK
jgi:peptide/nickel transport system substrate-binding protein